MGHRRVQLHNLAVPRRRLRISAGTKLPGFLAGELDYIWPGLYKQPGLTTLASGSAICHTNGRTAPMQATAYTAPSGARVLNGSTDVPAGTTAAKVRVAVPKYKLATSQQG